jgi:hypothetical protein
MMATYHTIHADLPLLKRVVSDQCDSSESPEATEKRSRIRTIQVPLIVRPLTVRPFPMLRRTMYIGVSPLAIRFHGFTALQ